MDNLTQQTQPEQTQITQEENTNGTTEQTQANEPEQQEQNQELPDPVKETIRKIREESKQRVAQEKALRKELEQKISSLSRELETLKAIQEGRSTEEVARQQLERELEEIKRERDELSRQLRVQRFLSTATQALSKAGYVIEDTDGELEQFVSRIMLTGDDEEDAQTIFYAIKAFAKPAAKTTGVAKPVVAQNVNTVEQDNEIAEKLSSMSNDSLYIAYGNAVASENDKLVKLIQAEIARRRRVNR